MALVSSQLLVDPVQKNSCQDLAWYREDGNPAVVVTFVCVTFPFEIGTATPLFAVDRDDLRVPNGRQQSL